MKPRVGSLRRRAAAQLPAVNRPERSRILPGARRQLIERRRRSTQYREVKAVTSQSAILVIHRAFSPAAARVHRAGRRP